MNFWADDAASFHNDPVYLEHENEAIVDAMRCVSGHFPREDGGNFLDIGCGDPERTKKNLKRATWAPTTTFGDKYPRLNVDEMEILDLKPDTYDVILCCRVLCNIPTDYRALALSSMYRALTSKGRLIFVDGFAKERENIQRARFEFGFDPLPGAPSGSTELDNSDRKLLEGGLFRPEVTENIAANHIIYTRVHQKILIPFGELRARATPRYTFAAQKLFGYYLGGVFTKVHT